MKTGEEGEKRGSVKKPRFKKNAAGRKKIRTRTAKARERGG